MCPFCCANSLVSHRRVLFVAYMYYTHLELSFDMLFAMVYAKWLNMVLSQLALNGMFLSSKVITGKIQDDSKSENKVFGDCIKFHVFITIWTIGLLKGCTKMINSNLILFHGNCAQHHGSITVLLYFTGLDMKISTKHNVQRFSKLLCVWSTFSR